MDDRQKLLEGVVNIHPNSRPRCSLVTTHMGTLLVLGIDYDSAVTLLNSRLTDEELNQLEEWETFVFTEGMPIEMRPHKKSIRNGWIVDVVEVTEDMWESILFEQANRRTQQAIQTSGLAVK